GIAAWNIYSVSYGTRLALVLMRDHPEGLRAVILDSAYPPEEHFFETRRATIAGAFAAVARACAADAACRQQMPDLQGALAQLVERYRGPPPLVRLGESGAGDEIRFTRPALSQEG